MDVRYDNVQIYFPEFWEKGTLDSDKKRIIANAESGKAHNGRVTFFRPPILAEASISKDWLVGFKEGGGSIEETNFKKETEELFNSVSGLAYNLWTDHVKDKSKSERRLQEDLYIVASNNGFKFFDHGYRMLSNRQSPFSVLMKFRQMDPFFLSGEYSNLHERAADIGQDGKGTVAYVRGNNLEHAMRNAAEIYMRRRDIERISHHLR